LQKVKVEAVLGKIDDKEMKVSEILMKLKSD